MSGRVGRHCHGQLYRRHCLIGPCPGCDCKIPLNRKNHNWGSFACMAWKPELDIRHSLLRLIVFESLLTPRIWLQLVFPHIYSRGLLEDLYRGVRRSGRNFCARTIKMALYSPSFPQPNIGVKRSEVVAEGRPTSKNSNIYRRSFATGCALPSRAPANPRYEAW